MALRRVEDERRERNDQVSGLFFTIFILLFGTILSFPAGAEQIGTGDDVRLEWAGAPIPGAARGLAIEHDLAYVAVTNKAFLSEPARRVCPGHREQWCGLCGMPFRGPPDRRCA